MLRKGQEERKMTPFTPLPGRKLHAKTRPFHSARECSTHALVSHDDNAKHAGLPDAPTQSPSQALCWAHPRWGWARSQTLVLGSRCFLLSGPRERERGRERRGLHNFPSSRTSNPASACAGRGGLPWKWRRKNWIECAQK